MKDIIIQSESVEDKEVKPGYFVKKLLGRVASLAHRSHDELSPYDFGLLEDVVNGLTPQEIAKRRKVHTSTITVRINQAIEGLERAVNEWESSVILNEKNDQLVGKLKEECETMYHYVLEKDERFASLEAQIASLNEKIFYHQIPDIPEPTQTYRDKPPTNALTKQLKRKIYFLHFPAKLLKSLLANGIETIFDLVILSESDLSEFPTITPEDITRISQALRMIDLSLGMKLRFDPSDGLFYVEE